MAVKSIDIIKSYLTEGKYPTASELIDVVDTLVNICQNSGGSVSYSHLELVPDLDTYTDAPVGKIVKYNGQTNNKYTRGWDYECVVDSSDDVITIPVGTKSCWLNNSSIENLGIDRRFYVLGTEQFNYGYTSSTGKVFWKQNSVVGDFALWQSASSATDYRFCRIIEILDNGIKYEYPTTSGYRTTTLHSSSPWTMNTLINADGIILYYWSNTIDTGTTNNKQIVDWDNQKSYYPTSVQTTQTTEEITIGTPTISWQPILMPSSNNVQTDVELSSSSHYPVENATLYDELRIEEAGSVLSVNGTNYPIVELDATDFDSIVYTGAGDTDFTFKVIPTLDSNKAYIIKNANFVESDNNDYSFSNQGTFIVKFQPSGNLGQYTSIAIGHNDTDAYNYYQTEGTEFNEWLSIPATYQFNVTDFGGYDNDTTIPYYGTPYEDGGNSTITELTNATETTGSASVIKSLKTKVAELEAQIAQISAQLQNIASN